jgi:hypothetical protein
LDNGTWEGEDRRDPKQSKIEYTLAKLTVKLDSLEANVTSKLDSNERLVLNQLEHVNTLIEHFMTSQEAVIEQLTEKFNMVLDAHVERNIETESRMAAQIKSLNERLSAHISAEATQISEIRRWQKDHEDAPAKQVFSKWQEMKSKVYTAIVSFILGGGLITFLVKLYEFLQTTPHK